MQNQLEKMAESHHFKEEAEPQIEYHLVQEDEPETENKLKESV